MKRILPMMLGLIALLSLVGCTQQPMKPPPTESKVPSDFAKPLPLLLEDLEADPGAPGSFLKKPLAQVKVEPAALPPVLTAAPEMPPEPDENTLKVRLAELTSHKEQCQYAVTYTERVLGYVKQHEESFIASWSARDIEWAGPLEPILDGYSQLRKKCQARLEGQRAELQRTVEEWKQASADLKKRLAR